MPLSYKEYTTGLNAITFNVPINYISINDIGALGYDGSEYTTLTIASRDAVNKTVTLDEAPSSYQTLRLFRSTTQASLVDFQNGSRLSESDLDTAYRQGLFVAQEISEDANTTQFAGLLNAGLMGGTSLANFASEDLSSQVDGTETVFNISNFEVLTTSTEAYRVTIDGIMQSPTDAYTLSANPARITFADPPPSGSKVIIVTAASAASSSTVDNQTVELFVDNGQSKIRVKNKGIGRAQIDDEEVISTKIKDKNVKLQHLETSLQNAIGKVNDADNSPVAGSTDLITSSAVYNAINNLSVGNLVLADFSPSEVVTDGENWTNNLLTSPDRFATNGPIEKRIRSTVFPKTFSRKCSSEFVRQSNNGNGVGGTGRAAGVLQWNTALTGATGGVTDSMSNTNRKLTVAAPKGTVFSYSITLRIQGFAAYSNSWAEGRIEVDGNNVASFDRYDLIGPENFLKYVDISYASQPSVVETADGWSTDIEIRLTSVSNSNAWHIRNFRLNTTVYSGPDSLIVL